MRTNDHLPVAIVGAGPVGLAAAAHLATRNIPFRLFEAGNAVGANLSSWGHVRVFSPWRYNIDKAARELLLKTDWTAPDDDILPTGKELVDHYFQPLSRHYRIAPYLSLNTKVESIGRKGMDKMKTRGREAMPFSIKLNRNGIVEYVEASAVIDASGTWNQPNPLGSGGVAAEGEEMLQSHIYYGIPDVKSKDLSRYKNKHVMVVGGGHSSINSLLDLAEVQKEHADTRLTWVLRKENLELVYGGKQDDALEARGALGIRIEALVNSGRLRVFTPFRILKLARKGNGLHVYGDLNGQETIIEDIDEIISNTGSRPNLDMIREVRIDLDASLESVFDLAELIDPNVHSCGTVRPHGERELRHPEKDFYIVGSKSYGRAPTFLMATGYEQVRSIVAHLDGDFEAAKQVTLDLPETGVCSSNLGDLGASSCCGATAAADSNEEVAAACCG